MNKLQASATFSKSYWEYPGGTKGTLTLSDGKLSFEPEDKQANGFDIPLNEISEAIIGTPTIIKSSLGARYRFRLTSVNPALSTRALGGAILAVAEEKAHLDLWTEGFKEQGVRTKDYTAKRVGKLFALGSLAVLVIIVLLLVVLH